MNKQTNIRHFSIFVGLG